MAQYFLSADEHAISRLTQVFSSAAHTLTIVSDEGEPALLLDVPGGSRVRIAYALDDAGVANDVEIIGLMKTTSTLSAETVGLGARMSSSGGGDDSVYFASAGGDNDGFLQKYSSGSRTLLASQFNWGPSGSNQIYHLRKLQITSVAGGAEVRSKSWLISDDEPANWDMTTTDDDANLQTGMAGIFVGRGSDQHYYRWIGIGTDGDPAPTEPVGPGDGVDITGDTSTLTIAASPGATSAGAIITGSPAQVALQAIAGTEQAGADVQGQVAQVAITPVPGGAQAGTSSGGTPVVLALTANPGGVVAGESLAVVVTGQSSNLSVSPNPGGLVIGQSIPGASASTGLTATPGSVVAGEAIPADVAGVTSTLSLSANPGAVSAGVDLTGAVIELSLSPQGGNVISGSVISGDPATLELIARAGTVFTGLVLVTPIRRTRALDESPIYSITDESPRYGVTTEA